MTPTIEEVKRVANTIYFPSSAGGGWVELTLEELQSFAQHWIEVGRKQKADEASELLNNLNRTISNMLAANSEAIRNNTGE